MSTHQKKRREERWANRCIARRIMLKRAEMGAKAEDIAKVIGLSEKEYLRIESGETLIPAARLWLIARVICSRAGWLLDDL